MQNLWKPKNRNEKKLATTLIWFIFVIISLLTNENGVITAILLMSSIGLTIYVWNSFSEDYDESIDINVGERKLQKKEEKKERSELYGQQVTFATLRYFGGGEINKEKDIIVTVTTTGLKYDKHFIPISSITSANLETQSQIKSRLTVTRMLAFGIFSLAAPKRTKSVEKYLTIEYEDAFNNTLILG